MRVYIYLLTFPKTLPPLRYDLRTRVSESSPSWPSDNIVPIPAAVLLPARKSIGVAGCSARAEESRPKSPLNGGFTCSLGSGHGRKGRWCQETGAGAPWRDDEEGRAGPEVTGGRPAAASAMYRVRPTSLAAFTGSRGLVFSSKGLSPSRRRWRGGAWVIIIDSD